MCGSPPPTTSSTRPRGCSKRVRATLVIRHKTAVRKLDKRVRGVRLRKGARLTIRISRPGFVAKLVRFAIKLGNPPVKAERCQAPGQARPGPC